MMAAAIAAFCAGVSAAVTVKLTSSIDDVLWLSSFLTPQISRLDKIRNVLTYTAVCMLQTCLAFILSRFGQSVLDNLMGGSDDDRMSTDRLLTLISGSALLLYSVVLGIDYYKEKYCDLYNNVDGEGSSAGNASFDSVGDTIAAAPEVHAGSQIELGFAIPRKQSEGRGALEIDVAPTFESEDDDNHADPPPKEKARSLAIIAFLGSLDDLTLFVPMLVGKAFNIFELMIGALLATLLIVFICLSLTRCRVVADLLEMIPLVAIVFSFSVILLVKGIIFMS